MKNLQQEMFTKVLLQLEHSEDSLPLQLNLKLQGKTQGMGFRPFVYQLAKRYGLAGWVLNSSQGVTLEVSGSKQQVLSFVQDLIKAKPKAANIVTVEYELNIAQISSIKADFKICHSEATAKEESPSSQIMSDLATCDDCLAELFDQNNRRYLYPFITCTNCGPRFSIINGLPYDRPQTTMASFIMCAACQAEYDDPDSRRFHSQTNACWGCGPQLTLVNTAGKMLATGLEAISLVVDSLSRGEIVALKSTGGFHLLVDPFNERAVKNLRCKKQRPSKPLAVMFPVMKSIAEYCEISAIESELLTAMEAPIVLLSQKASALAVDSLKQKSKSLTANANNYLSKENYPQVLSTEVTKGSNKIGAFLPCSALHHVLLKLYVGPLIATSGNISGQPICITNASAREELSTICDLFLCHDREIVNRVDDSVVQVAADKPMFLRRGRGYSPYYLPINMPPVSAINLAKQQVTDILALGGEQKNSFAFKTKNFILYSQYIGDLTMIGNQEFFQQQIAYFKNLYKLNPKTIAHDLHPNYQASIYGQKLLTQIPNLTAVKCQHHHAHVASCLLEHGFDESDKVIAIAWDGSGYGLDQTVWGGEFLWASISVAKRFASFRAFPLAGGDYAIKNPIVAALGVLSVLYQDKVDSLQTLAQLGLSNAANEKRLQLSAQLLAKDINSPQTSSVGRLFDVVAVLLGLQHEKINYEGEAAVALQVVAEDYVEAERLNFNKNCTKIKTSNSYNYRIMSGENISHIVDWEPMLLEILADIKSTKGAGYIAYKFHVTLAKIALAVIALVDEKELSNDGNNAAKKVVLTGGCFQNKLLLELVAAKLIKYDYEVYWPQQLPLNDAGLALGQVGIASSLVKASEVD